MIEVSLYSVPVNSDINVSMGRCVDRTRFDKETLGTGVMEFVKGFLKTNVPNFEVALNNADIIGFINGDQTMTTKDFASINYYLAKAGYIVKIQNVTDDEENPTGVSSETAEWNIIDYNFMQFDYPTAIKIIPAEGMDVVAVLKQVVDQSGLFDADKIGGIRNPLKETIDQLEKIKNQIGRIEPGLATKIYDTLDQVGVKVFLATGE
jgi:hypothetical protein